MNVFFLSGQLEEYAIGMEIEMEVIANNFKLFDVRTKPVLARPKVNRAIPGALPSDGTFLGS